MGDIVDMAEFRKKKAERQLSQRQFHPAGQGLFGDAKKQIDERLFHQKTFDLLKGFPDQTIHELGSGFGHIPKQMDIMKMKDLDYDTVRWDLAMNPDFHYTLGQAFKDTDNE